MPKVDQEVQRGLWYPNMPPRLDGEDNDAYTNRLTGADGTNRYPYTHQRNRQCSIGYHDECSDRTNSGQCECPCHEWKREANERVSSWNATYPVGTVVTFPSSAGEPPVATTGSAYVDDGGEPVVELDTFLNPVHIAWITAEVTA
jgi:hypothetical protein